VSKPHAQHGTVVVLGVNERDHGTLYNTQLVFDADGTLVKRRKITPTYHERMIWGQGDASGLKVVPTAVGRLGALACWEHYNPLARYSLMAQHEEIHCAQFPGSMVGQIFADQMESPSAITHWKRAVSSSMPLAHDEQIAAIEPDPKAQKAPRGCCTAIVRPKQAAGRTLRSGEGILVADLDMELVTKRKRMMDSVGHYARPELLHLVIDDRRTSYVFPVPGPNSLLLSSTLPRGPSCRQPSSSCIPSVRAARRPWN
jgi:aliphatic nitrilase